MLRTCGCKVWCCTNTKLNTYTYTHMRNNPYCSQYAILSIEKNHFHLHALVSWRCCLSYNETMSYIVTTLVFIFMHNTSSKPWSYSSSVGIVLYYKLELWRYARVGFIRKSIPQYIWVGMITMSFLCLSFSNQTQYVPGIIISEFTSDRHCYHSLKVRLSAVYSEVM